MPLYYAYGLLMLFYFLLVLEFFIPSAGIVGVIAVVTVIAAIAVAFAHSFQSGLTMLLIVAATTPLVFIGAIRVWPHTPIGRRILNRRPGQVEDGVSRKTLPDGTLLDEIIGRTGIAKTDLLPSGLVKVQHHRVDAVSLGMPIDAGTRVIVTKIEAGKVYVRPFTQLDEKTVESETPKSPEVLESPPESFDFDTLN